MPTPVKMPRLGESVAEGTIGAWLKQEGDMVGKDESLAEIITDKITAELPSPFAGRLAKILVKADETVAVGTDIALIEESAEVSAAPPTQAAPAPAMATAASSVSAAAAPAPPPSAMAPPAAPAPAIAGEDEELVTPSRMRLAIAEHMVRTKRTAPHATTFMEVDMTNIARWLEKNKEEFRRKNGYGISYVAFVMKATCEGLRKFPMVNASWTEDNKIILKKRINMGMEVAIE